MQAKTGETERADETACMGHIHPVWSLKAV